MDDKKGSCILWGIFIAIVFVVGGLVYMAIRENQTTTAGPALQATPVHAATLAVAEPAQKPAEPVKTAVSAAAAKAPVASPGAQKTVNFRPLLDALDAFVNMPRLGAIHPLLGVAGFFHILTLLIDVFLLIGFFLPLVRSLWGLLRVLPTFLLPYLPGILASILPEPYAGFFSFIFVVVFIGLLIWAFIDWLRSRKTSKVSVTSLTRQVRIEPYCIFCKQFTTNVMEHHEESDTTEGNTRRYYSATFPYPAHEKCDQRKRESDARKNKLLFIFGGYLGVILIFEVVAIIILQKFPEANSVLTAGLVVICLTTFLVIAASNFTKANDLIYEYVGKHAI